MKKEVISQVRAPRRPCPIRKRAIQTPFTWIIITIAGVIILTFFLTIGLKQKSLSENKVSIQLEGELDAIISTAIQSPGSSQTLPIPRQGLATHCTATCDCQLGVGKEPKGSGFEENIYFSHDYLTEDGTLWTQRWKNPHHITNFLYLTSNEVHYYIVYDDSGRALKEALAEKLPTTLSVEFIKGPEIRKLLPPENKEIKFLFLDVGKENLPASFNDLDVRAAQANSKEASFWFKEKKRASWEQEGTRTLLGKEDVPLITAAMISANHDMFVCGLKHAYTKLSLTAQILEQRAEQLHNASALEARGCSYAGLHGSSRFSNLSSTATLLSNDVNNNLAVSQLGQEAEQLERLNTEKLQEQCPALYRLSAT